MLRLAGDRAYSFPWVLFYGEDPFRDVVAPEVGRAEIAEGDLGGFVPDLAHEIGETGALIAGGGGQPGAQRVSRVFFGIEPGGSGGALDQARDRLVGQREAGQKPGLAYAAEQRQR